jgi:hypothetical protein
MLLEEKVKNLYEDSIDLKKKNIIDVINELQEDYKKKYFFKEPILIKSSKFLEKYKVKKKWKDFQLKK